MAFVNLFTPSTVTAITTGASTFTALTFSAGGQIRIKNIDTTNGAYFKFGNTADSAVTSSNGIFLGPGDVAGFTAPGATTGIFTLAAAGTPILNVVQGWGS